MVTQRGVTGHEIRRASLELFNERGYDATSIRDIAAAVGIRGSSIYNHYAAKSAILADLTTAALDELEGSWHAAGTALDDSSPTGRLRAFVANHVRYHAEHSREANLINGLMRSLSEADFDRAAERRHLYQNELARIVDDGLTTGEFATTDRHLAVFAILQMGMAVATWYRPDGPLSVDGLCAGYVDMAIKLLAPGSPGSGP